MKEQPQTIFLLQEVISDGCTYSADVSLAAFTKEALASGVCEDIMRRTKNTTRDFCVKPITVYAFGDPAALAKTILRDSSK